MQGACGPAGHDVCLQRPGPLCAAFHPLLPMEAFFPDDPEEDADQEIESDIGEGGSSYSSLESTPRAATRTRTVDRLAQLEAENTDAQVLGVLRVVVDTLGDLWEQGATELVAALAEHFYTIDSDAELTSVGMFLLVLRRLTAGYRVAANGIPLPPLWSTWTTRVLERLRETSTFAVEEGAHMRYGLSTPEDATCLMQSGGRRLPMSARLVRPARPREWQQVLAELSRLPPMVADRAKAIVRAWITARINRVASVCVSLGQMLRDVLHYSSLDVLPPALEQQASQSASESRLRLQEWFDRCCGMDLFATQPFLIQEAIRLALQVDEMNLTLLPFTDSEAEQNELEEVHLMFRINNVVREALEGPPQERARRLQVLLQALRHSMGSEARHLRRIGVSLHGLQMIGIICDNVYTVGHEQDDTWLPQLLDEIHMMAGSETAGVSSEGPWSTEVIRLRRWLAEDRLQPGDDHPVNATARGSADNAEGTGNNTDEQTEADARDEEDSSLVQRGKPPWRPWWSSTTRSARARSRSPRRRHTARRDRREAEREVERSNVHRPWRLESSASRPDSHAEERNTSSRGSVDAPGPALREPHPATVHLPAAGGHPCMALSS